MENKKIYIALSVIIGILILISLLIGGYILLNKSSNPPSNPPSSPPNGSGSNPPSSPPNGSGGGSGGVSSSSCGNIPSSIVPYSQTKAAGTKPTYEGYYTDPKMTNKIDINNAMSWWVLPTNKTGSSVQLAFNVFTPGGIPNDPTGEIMVDVYYPNNAQYIYSIDSTDANGNSNMSFPVVPGLIVYVIDNNFNVISNIFKIPMNANPKTDVLIGQFSQDGKSITLGLCTLYNE